MTPLNHEKQGRLLEIFFRGFRGEGISIAKLAQEHGVSNKSIQRDVRDLKLFLADHRDLVGNTELQYNYQSKCYQLCMDGFLSNKELFALVEVMIGARAFSKLELLELTEKLKRLTTPQDRPKIQALIRKEMVHYAEVKHDCDSVEGTLWRLANCILERREISVDYYRMDHSLVSHRLRPASVLFTDYYFYLIAYKPEETEPSYFRVDRIRHITEHRGRFPADAASSFDEGLLRKRSLFMWPGKLRTIRFEFSGPSVQAVLDKLPTARVLEKRDVGRYLIEAEVYGDGIRMWLLSQGNWVKVTGPPEFVEEMKQELVKTLEQYR